VVRQQTQAPDHERFVQEFIRTAGAAS
jgi:hypothetical protein